MFGIFMWEIHQHILYIVELLDSVQRLAHGHDHAYEDTHFLAFLPMMTL